MRDRPLITRVVLENYKSIGFCDVKLGPLAILVGPNESGKSNFLSALKFLSECMNGGVDAAFRQRSGFPRVLRRNGSAAHLGLRVDFLTAEGLSGHYSVRFTPSDAAGYIIEREECIEGRLRYEGRNGVLTGSDCPRPEQQASDLYLPKYPCFSSTYRVLSSCHFYNFSPKDLRNPNHTGHEERFLRNDGVNLTNVFELIRLLHPDVSERITQYLRVLNPALLSIRAVESGSRRNLEFSLHDSKGTFSPNEVSDGTLRSLAVLVALFQARGGADNVSLVGLEEPESALHPAAAGVLFDALREASASVQVLATTHSADLLDKKEVDTDSILSVAFEDGATRIGPVDQTGREVLRRRLYTAGELMRMNHLQPRPSADPRPEEVEAVLFGDLVSA